MHGLSADKMCDYVKELGLRNASFGISHLIDYFWQPFKNRRLFSLQLFWGSVGLKFADFFHYDFVFYKNAA